MPLESLKGIYYLDVTLNVMKIYRGPLATSDPDGFRRGKPNNWSFRVLNEKLKSGGFTFPLDNDDIAEITRRSGIIIGRRKVIGFESVPDATAIAVLIESGYPSSGPGSVKISVKPANSLPEFQMFRSK